MEIELIHAVNDTLADILVEAANILCESDVVLTLDEVIQRAVFNLATMGIENGTEH